MSLVTGPFCLILLLNQRWSPPLRLQVSHCSTFRIMCHVPSIIIIIIITPKYRWCEKTSCFMFSHQNPVFVSFPFRVCSKLRISHFPGFDQRNIWRRFLPLRPNFPSRYNLMWQTNYKTKSTTSRILIIIFFLFQTRSYEIPIRLKADIFEFNLFFVS
jgi:hypothetical protein